MTEGKQKEYLETTTENEKYKELQKDIQIAVKYSPSIHPILLTGPTGSGKTRLAQKIYDKLYEEKIVTGKFISLNCAALTGDLVNDALFGHKKNAYTDAKEDKNGYLKNADKGILFLDEIGTLGLDVQAKLLKAIEEHKFQPVGGYGKEEKSDFRLICGTNADLQDAVEKGNFRRDLYERITTWIFELPGLAERREDIVDCMKSVLKDLGTGGFDDEAQKTFKDFAMKHPWEGNFRELIRMAVRMFAFAKDKNENKGENKVKVKITNDVVKKVIRMSSNQSNLSPLEDLIKTADEKAGERGLCEFDKIQLRSVLGICQQCETQAEAAKKLFGESKSETNPTGLEKNPASRLQNYLSRMLGKKFKDIKQL